MRSQLKGKTLTSICCINQHSASFLHFSLLHLRSVFSLNIAFLRLKDLRHDVYVIQLFKFTGIASQQCIACLPVSYWSLPNRALRL